MTKKKNTTSNNGKQKVDTASSGTSMYFMISVVMALIAVVVFMSQNKQDIAAVEKPKVKNNNSFSLDPADYVSTAAKVDSKRIGGAKKDAIVNLGDANGKGMTLEELGLPFVTYMHKTPPVGIRERPMGAKFRSFKNYPLIMYWDNGSPEGVYSGGIKAMGYTATNTYTTHTFIFKKKLADGSEEEVVRFTMRDDRHLMIIEPDADQPQVFQSEDYLHAKAEQRYMKEYYGKYGTPWLSYYPREKPRLNIWPADYVGQTHKVTSFQGFFSCNPDTKSLEECYDDTPVELELVVVSTAPRVLVVKNLMSDWECEHIKELGKEIIRRSSVGSETGGFQSDTRTSENGWLSRHKDAVVDTIFRRYADALGIRDEDLEHDVSAEHLQVVRYLKGQEYKPHHDFGYTGKPNMRFLTLLLYIEVPEEGGHTSFPKAHDGKGMKVLPPKGSGALFYSMKPDGNGDDMSLHAGTPVITGQKWICNLWVWDPFKI